MENYDPIEEAIRLALDSIPEDAERGGWTWERTNWTRKVKARLFGLAKDCSPSYDVCASDCSDAKYGEPQYGEWLYDLCWYVEDEVCLLQIPLVAEIEWSPDGSCDGDFQKLLQARAEHRLWVFQMKTPEDVRRIFQECRDVINRFRGSQPGDRYLMAGVTYKPRKFWFDLYVH